jgi:ribonuclease BN (tRNA processing enzyme)
VIWRTYGTTGVAVIGEDGPMISRLTVLGSCGAWPEPGRAGSGFLLEHDGYRVVLDLGYGTLPRLLSLLGSPYAEGLDAVVVTHEHPDHMLDLQPLFRARWFGRHRGLRPLPLYVPAGVLAAVALVERDELNTVRQVFAWHELPAAAPYDVGPFRFSSLALPHFRTERRGTAVHARADRRVHRRHRT